MLNWHYSAAKQRSSKGCTHNGSGYLHNFLAFSADETTKAT
jgi:hypothetical protein